MSVYRFLYRSLVNDGISFADDIAPHHELFHALLQVDYRTVSIADFDERVFVPLDYFYRIGNIGVFDDTPLTAGNILEVDAHFLRDALDLIELLTLRTPYSISICYPSKNGAI